MADLGLRDGLVGEVLERRSTPELERLAQGVPGFCGVTAGEGVSPLLEQLSEAVEVALSGLDPQHVPVLDGNTL